MKQEQKAPLPSCTLINIIIYIHF